MPMTLYIITKVENNVFFINKENFSFIQNFYSHELKSGFLIDLNVRDIIEMSRNFKKCSATSRNYLKSTRENVT